MVQIKNEIKVEPYWNVKIDEGTTGNLILSIKVEPYWNVKYNITDIMLERNLMIKVEPYWNVKQLFAALTFIFISD